MRVLKYNLEEYKKLEKQDLGEKPVKPAKTGIKVVKEKKPKSIATPVDEKLFDELKQLLAHYNYDDAKIEKALRTKKTYRTRYEFLFEEKLIYTRKTPNLISELDRYKITRKGLLFETIVAEDPSLQFVRYLGRQVISVAVTSYKRVENAPYKWVEVPNSLFVGKIFNAVNSTTFLHACDIQPDCTRGARYQLIKHHQFGFDII